MDQPDKPEVTERTDAEASAGEGSPRRDTRELPVTRGAARKIARLYALAGGLFSAAAGIGAGYAVFIAKAEAAGKKAAVEAEEKAAQADRKAENTAQALSRVQSEFTTHVEVESHGRIRMEKKMNALLNRFDVPDPAPTPKDAGR